jgi:hypothetical protein
MTIARRRSRSVHRWLATALASLSVVTAAWGAVDPAAWKHRQEFDLAQAGLVKIPLPVETIDLARPGLPDLRVLGPSGQEVPYLIETARPAEPVKQPPRSFRVQLEKISTILLIETGTDAPIEAVELITRAAEFVKAARVEQSDDREHWTLVGEGFPLSRSHGSGAVSLPTDRLTARYLRVTVDDWRTLPVTFSGATLRLAAAGLDPALPLTTSLAQREEFARETVLTVTLPARHLPLAWIEFDVVEPRFSRAVTVAHRTLRDGELAEETLAGGAVVRSDVGSARVEQLRVAIDRTVPTRELQVKISNHDDAPLTIRRISVYQRPVSLIISAPEPGRHTLLTGHSRIAAPVYDLRSLAANLRALPETTVDIHAAQPNPNFQSTDALADTPLLGAPLDVTPWSFQKTVTPSSAGVQELELDLEVLAHASPSLADLRLIRDGRQAPYLLERTALRRSLMLKPIPADDPQQPRVSRWKLALPLAGVPLTRLTLASGTPLFTRSVQVFEWIVDRHGESQRRYLGSAHWTSIPSQPTPQLPIELSPSPQTDTLYVETDNGDNPPIALGDARAEYPVTRLLFRADAQPLQLHFGNDGAAAPRYDLALVAPQILSEEKKPAVLSQENGADGRGARAFFPGIRSGVLLWSVLALVVAMLLFLIARLLPKPPAKKP